MASTNKTPNYNLSQFLGTDRIQRDDYNSDMSKIDTELLKKINKTDGIETPGGYIQTISRANLDTAFIPTGFYYANSCPGRPVNYDGYLIMEQYSDRNFTKQTYSRTDTGETWIRTKIGGTWKPWSKQLDENNGILTPNKNIQSLIEVDLDTENIPTGLYFAASCLNRPYGENGYLLVERSADTNYCKQTYARYSNGETWVRVKSAGTIGEWIKQLDETNGISTPNGRAVQLPNGTDLNTIKKTGPHSCYQPVNAPPGAKDACYLEVIQYSGGEHIKQTFTELGGTFGTGPGNQSRQWFRVKIDGVWKPWQEILTDSNFNVTIPSDITVTVGAGAQYATINEALEYLSEFYPKYKSTGIEATVMLKSGFVMEEQIVVSAINLSWITIKGEDSETIINKSSLTINTMKEELGTVFPAFTAKKGGKLPKIGQLFNMNTQPEQNGKHGIYIDGEGSSCTILPYCGVIRCNDCGLMVKNGGSVEGVNSQFNNSFYGAHISYGSTANLARANLTNSASGGIFCLEGATVNANHVNCSNCENGIYAQGAVVNASYAKCSGAKKHGVYSALGARINIQGGDCSNTSMHGIYCARGSFITAYNAVGSTNVTPLSITRAGIIIM